MLAMQAANLEQQERLFKTQIRLGLREILQQEMAFYITAFHNINTCGSVLAGFAFSGLLLKPYTGPDEGERPSDLSQSQSLRLAMIFNGLCCLTTCLSLLTLIYANYLGLFSSRLALRGGDMAVETTVARLRREYKVVLHLLTCSVLSFLTTLPVLSFYKMEKKDSLFVTCLAMPAFFTVIFLYNRARRLFYLNKEDRFASSRRSGDHPSGDKKINLRGSWADSDTSFHENHLRAPLVSTDDEVRTNSEGDGLFGGDGGRNSKKGWGHQVDGGGYSSSSFNRYSEAARDSAYHRESGGGGGGGYSSGYSSGGVSGSQKKRHPDYYRGYVEGSLSSRPVEANKADYLRGFVEGSLTSSPKGYGSNYNEKAAAEKVHRYSGGGGGYSSGKRGGRQHDQQFSPRSNGVLYARVRSMDDGGAGLRARDIERESDGNNIRKKFWRKMFG